MRKECSDCKYHVGTRIEEYCNADDGEEFFLEPYKCPSFTWRDKRLEITDKWIKKLDDILAPHMTSEGWVHPEPTFDELAEAVATFSTDLTADEYNHHA